MAAHLSTSIQNWANPTGAFVRQASSFRDVVSENSRFLPEPHRYHLYISLACPWAHRTFIALKLKGLEKVIGVTVVDWLLQENGWKFDNEGQKLGCSPDPLKHNYLKELYLRADPTYSAPYTVPVLWDNKENTIVNNESSEILRILNSSFNNLAGNPSLDLYPKELREEIDLINEWIYNGLNNGVYKAGFATSQDQYELNANLVKDTLERLEDLLRTRLFLAGNHLTEADIRCFTTVVRFDPVYYGHFKCNLLAIKDCPSILNWARRVYQIPGVKETVNMTHIKCHYYMSHVKINPTQIVPLSNGPDLSVPAEIKF